MRMADQIRPDKRHVEIEKTMNNIIDEFLTDVEVVKLTGTENPALQIKRLEKNGWVFTVALRNNRKVPVVGRYYTRLRMSGRETEKWVQKKEPHFDKVS